MEGAQARLDPAVAESIVQRAVLPASIGLTAAYAFFLASDVLLRPPEVGLAILPGDIACFAYFLAIGLAAWRGGIPSAWSQAAIGSLGIVLLASIFHLFLVQPDPVHTIYLMLLVIGAGSLVLSWPWFALIAVAALTEWLVLAVDGGLSETWMNFGFGLVASVALGGMMHGSRIRTFARIDALRAQDVRSQSEIGRTLAEVRLHEDRFQLLAAATQDVAWDWNVRAGKFWWNDRFYERLGYARGRDEAHLSFWTSRIHPADRARVVASLHTAMDGGGTSWTEEYRCRHADGTYLHVLDRARVLRDEAGRAIRMVGSMMDVTAARETEEKLRHEKELYASLLEALGRAGHAMALVQEGRVSYANDAAREALALPPNGDGSADPSSPSRAAGADAQTAPLVALALAALADDGGSRVDLQTRAGVRITAHSLERGTNERVLLVAERQDPS